MPFVVHEQAGSKVFSDPKPVNTVNTGTITPGKISMFG